MDVDLTAETRPKAGYAADPAGFDLQSFAKSKWNDI
jgi:hypothetical protein